MAGVATGSKMQMGGFPCHQFDVSDVAGARARGGVESERRPRAASRCSNVFNVRMWPAAGSSGSAWLVIRALHSTPRLAMWMCSRTGTCSLLSYM